MKFNYQLTQIANNEIEKKTNIYIYIKKKNKTMSLVN
jgi:hypothetical protein